MEEKIIEYVNYRFRFRKGKDVEESKAEIIANLTDRYYDLLKEGKSMQEAYVEAIRSFGSFTDDLTGESADNDFNVKPSLADIALVVGAILSVFGVFTSLISFTLGLILTIISILCYAGGAYYLYSYSQYVKLQELDIEKHNLTLKKIFKYLKTSYVFWAISLSYFAAKLVSILISFISALFIITDPWDIKAIFYTQIILSTLVFIVAIIVSILVFSNLYNRLLQKYYQLTGEVYLKSKIREGYEFFYQDNIKNDQPPRQPRSNVNRKNYNSNRKTYIFIIVSTLFVAIANLFLISYYPYEHINVRVSGPIISLLPGILYSSSYLAGIFYISGVALYIVTVIFVLMNKINYKWLILAIFLWLAANFAFASIMSSVGRSSLGIYGFYVVALILIGFIAFIVWSIITLVNRVNKRTVM